MKNEQIGSSLIERESFFWTPDYLEQSAWIEHVPFAFWLIDVLRPRMVVELGVHSGMSYFAFCQAVKRLNLNATCYGVDTWKGDEHAGLYDEEVFGKVAGHNARYYSRFSTLVRSTFDEASGYFIDGSIDLLHIDGLHTYEAVKHDFDTWLPKLAPNALVLFHDINVRERGFGVFRFWEELKAQYKHFQFDFGHGLGIVALGAIPEELTFLMQEAGSGAYYLFLRNLFSDRGNFFKKELDFSQALIREVQNLESQKAALVQLIERYEQLAEQYRVREAAERHLQEQLNKSGQLLEETKRLLAESNRQLEELNRQLEESHQQVEEKDKEVESVYLKEIERYEHLTDELFEKLEAAQSSSRSLADELTQLRRENDLFRQYFTWYKSTFEDRSLLGVIKEKSKSKLKRLYIGYIDALLRKEAIKNKYAVSYSLDYVKENGLKFTASKIISLIKNDGFESFSRSALRKKAIAKLTGPPAPAPRQVPSIDLDQIRDAVSKLEYTPKISIVIPTYNTKPELLHLAIKSIKNQVYENWELCIADDCSKIPETKNILTAYQRDAKIKVHFLEENVGIADASNAAIELASGDFIALMDHDDEITPDALYWVVKKLNEQREADILYSDECKVDEQGNLSDYFFKPEWSPELLLNMMYIGHLTVYRKAFLLEQVGLFRKEYNFSQDYDLALRATEKTENIHHIDKVIYHWRLTEGSSSQGDKPYARISNLAALADAAKRRNIAGEVLELPTANRLKIKVPSSRKVSIIIPTDSFDNLRDTIEAIDANTAYSNYEILPVTNSRLIAQMQSAFSWDRVSYVAYDKPYNFSDKCNEGAQQATGEIVVFFNDDVRPLESDWLENTIEFLEIPEIGGVSPKLIYEDNTIQYAGMATGVRNLTGTTFHCYHKDSTNYLNFPQLVRNVSILSGACVAVKKDLFLRIGGFDAVNTPIGHSDVDLSFKILEAGYRCVYTPYAVLRHIGHLSLKTFEEEEVKQKTVKKDKADIFLLKRWGKFLDDRYFTEPMKAYLYHDSPEHYKVYGAQATFGGEDKGHVLLVSHDLSLSGAPLMLYSVAKILKELGYFVVVVAPQDGALQKMYHAIDVSVIVDELVFRQHPSFERFAKNFDYIICNTILSWPVVRQMQDLVKTIWWVHEGQLINSYLSDPQFVTTLKRAKNIVGVSDYNISFLKPYNSHITKLYNCCESTLQPANTAVADGDKVIFSLVGSIEPRKGHDVLIDALEKVSPELLKKAEVWIIGRTLDREYLNNLLDRINKLSSVKLIGEKSHAECMELMQQSHVVLNPSRDDPFPVVLVEAFCLGKTCVVSSNSGVAELIEDGQNGFIFKSENSEELAYKLRHILRNKQALGNIGSRARRIYEDLLTKESAKANWDKYIESIAQPKRALAGKVD